MDVPHNRWSCAHSIKHKVVNALIQGMARHRLSISGMARDLSRPMDEGATSRNFQDEVSRPPAEKAREQFAGDFGRRPSGVEFEVCFTASNMANAPIRLEALDLNRVVRRGYRSITPCLLTNYDDSKSNKSAVPDVKTKNKGNRTPYGIWMAPAIPSAGAASSVGVEGTKPPAGEAQPPCFPQRERRLRIPNIFQRTVT